MSRIIIMYRAWLCISYRTESKLFYFIFILFFFLGLWRTPRPRCSSWYSTSWRSICAAKLWSRMWRAEYSPACARVSFRHREINKRRARLRSALFLAGASCKNGCRKGPNFDRFFQVCVSSLKISVRFFYKFSVFKRWEAIELVVFDWKCLFKKKLSGVQFGMDRLQSQSHCTEK